MNDNTQIQKKEDYGFFEIVKQTKITKKGCKCCESKFREEAEELFEKTNNIRAVRKFLEEKGQKISYLAVRNHINKHYLGTERLQSVKEWLEDVNRYSSNKSDRVRELRGRKNALNREFLLIAAGTDGESLEERRKSADALKKISDTMISIEDKIDDIENEKAPVEILIENFQQIIADKIKKTTTEEVKRVLLDTLTELSDSVGGMSIEEKK